MPRHANPFERLTNSRANLIQLECSRSFCSSRTACSDPNGVIESKTAIAEHLPLEDATGSDSDWLLSESDGPFEAFHASGTDDGVGGLSDEPSSLAQDPGEDFDVTDWVAAA